MKTAITLSVVPNGPAHYAKGHRQGCAGRLLRSVCSLAKAKIGRENEGWAPLAEATSADNERKGYPVPAPLLRRRILDKRREAEKSLNESEIRGVN
jgi:hypothetical protein